MVLLTSEQDQGKDMIDVKNKQTENMNNHEVYRCVPYTGQKYISIKLVIPEKYKDNKIMNVRLFAYGYKDDLCT